MLPRLLVSYMPLANVGGLRVTWELRASIACVGASKAVLDLGAHRAGQPSQPLSTSGARKIMGQKGSREAQEAPRAQDREKSPRAPRQTAGDEWAQTVTNGGARFVPLAATVAAPEPRPPPPPRPVREIYARYLAATSLDGIWSSVDMALAERRRITGLEEDPKPLISQWQVNYIADHGGVEVTRSTTLGALSQMRLWGQRSCKSFINSAAASVTIDELGDYSDPETGLEHHLEGCPTDEEKMAMRVAVFRGLTLIFVLLEKDELHQIIIQGCREASDRLEDRGSDRGMPSASSLGGPRGAM